jgi:hypothetical protein
MGMMTGLFIDVALQRNAGIYCNAENSEGFLADLPGLSHRFFEFCQECKYRTLLSGIPTARAIWPQLHFLIFLSSHIRSRFASSSGFNSSLGGRPGAFPSLNASSHTLSLSAERAHPEHINSTLFVTMNLKSSSSLWVWLYST